MFKIAYEYGCLFSRRGNNEISFCLTPEVIIVVCRKGRQQQQFVWNLEFEFLARCTRARKANACRVKKSVLVPPRARSSMHCSIQFIYCLVNISAVGRSNSNTFGSQGNVISNIDNIFSLRITTFRVTSPEKWKFLRRTFRKRRRNNNWTREYEDRDSYTYKCGRFILHKK